MNKNWVIATVLIVIIGGLYFLSQSRSPQESTQTEQSSNTESLVSSSQYTKNTNQANYNIKADKVEVVHFHTTRQCYSCITLGKYAKKVVEEKLASDNQSRKVVFLDVNVDLPENKEIVAKFKARGSALFVNIINEGQDHIQEDTRVWYLLSNETEFSKYLENKLKGYL